MEQTERAKKEAEREAKINYQEQEQELRAKAAEIQKRLEAKVKDATYEATAAKKR